MPEDADLPAVAAEIPARTPRSVAWWLTPLGVFAVVAVGILWAIPRPEQLCPLIYPAPPECATGGDPSAVIPFLVLIVALYAAIVTCALLIPARLRPLVLGLLAGGLALVFLVGLATSLAAGSAPTIYYD